MNDTTTYLIQLRGHVDEREINGMSPLAMTVEWVDDGVTTAIARSDQAGLVGLLRHLHGLGFVFLSITRQDGSVQ